MKRTFLLLAMMAGLGYTCMAQKEEKEEGRGLTPPAAAKAAFTKAFPGISKVRWEKEGANYEVNFMQSHHEMSAVYTAQGALMETEMEIKPGDLPAAALTYLKTHHKGQHVEEAAKITKAGGEVNYEAVIKGMAQVFDANGNFLKTEKD